MNQTSLDKIKASAKFLIWFCYVLPRPLQQVLRPYLDQPYRLSLSILDYCGNANSLTIEEISSKANINKETIRQVLKALQSGGMKFQINAAKNWEVLELNLQPLMADEQLLTEELIAESSLGHVCSKNYDFVNNA